MYFYLYVLHRYVKICINVGTASSRKLTSAAVFQSQLLTSKHFLFSNSIFDISVFSIPVYLPILLSNNWRTF